MAIQEISTLPKNGVYTEKTAASLHLLDQGLQAVEKLMYDVVASDVTVLRDASRHILQAGGKRIRPRMVLLSYLACGGRDIERVIPVASAVELVHTASVVHDDINDHGIVRRGRPSVNSIWGRTFALLTGDFLFTKVYELMAPFGDLNILLADATIALVEGETLQASAVKDNNFTRQVYYDIIARKTAALFKSGAMLGAKLANAPASYVEVLGNYGFNLGLAFQIIDDVLDLTGNTEQLGKTAGIDLEQGRGFAAVYEGGQDLMESIKRKVLKGDVLQEAREQAQQLIDMAVIGLNILPETPERDDLIDLSHLVIDRTH
ncbi:MAG: polyprenyl synthetase family protein [Anaerolineae bacterium]|jgi:geranylgeranyl pyrophosphate synthase|nr:polyprenyl synthetase family protein [Anaerolineae bacterium]